MWEVVDIFVGNFFLTAGRRQRVAGLTREQRAPIREGLSIRLHHIEQLSENAPHRPHIDGTIVVPLQQNKLRRPIPPRGDMPRQLNLGLLGLRLNLHGGSLRPRIQPSGFNLHFRRLFAGSHRPSESEVTELHLVPTTVEVDEDVLGLEVAVEHLGAVQVFDGDEDAVGDVLDFDWVQEDV